MPDELLQVESPDSFQRGAYTASDKALRGKKSLATSDYFEIACKHSYSDIAVDYDVQSGMSKM